MYITHLNFAHNLTYTQQSQYERCTDCKRSSKKIFQSSCWRKHDRAFAKPRHAQKLWWKSLDIQVRLLCHIQSVFLLVISHCVIWCKCFTMLLSRFDVCHAATHSCWWDETETLFIYANDCSFVCKWFWFYFFFLIVFALFRFASDSPFKMKVYSSVALNTNMLRFKCECLIPKLTPSQVNQFIMDLDTRMTWDNRIAHLELLPIAVEGTKIYVTMLLHVCTFPTCQIICEWSYLIGVKLLLLNLPTSSSRYVILNFGKFWKLAKFC